MITLKNTIIKKKDNSSADLWIISFFVIFLLTTLTRLFNLKVIQDVTSDPEFTGTNMFASIVGMVVFIVSVNYMVINRKLIRLPVRSLFPMFILLLWAQLSVLWSSNPFMTEQRWFKAVIYISIIINIFQTPSPVITLRKLLYIFSWICAGSSLILILFFKQYGFMNYGDGYLPCGIFMHKNGLGIFAASMILVLATTFVWPGQCGLKKMPYGYKILFCLLFLEMIISRAMDVICGFIISVFFIVLFQIVKDVPGKPRLFPVIISAIPIIILSVVASVKFIDLQYINSLILDVIGKNATFSGRTDFWPILLSIGIRYHLILGSGFGVFFIFMDNAGLMQFMDWAMTHAHNTYLQIFLELGIIGTAIVLIMVIIVLIDILRFWKHNPIPASFLMGIYSLFIVQSVFESILLRPCIMYFVFSCIACIAGSGLKMKESYNFHDN